jgi:hypothetical protein
MTKKTKKHSPSCRVRRARPQSIPARPHRRPGIQRPDPDPWDQAIPDAEDPVLEVLDDTVSIDDPTWADSEAIPWEEPADPVTPDDDPINVDDLLLAVSDQHSDAGEAEPPDPGPLEDEDVVFTDAFGVLFVPRLRLIPE